LAPKRRASKNPATSAATGGSRLSRSPHTKRGKYLAIREKHRRAPGSSKKKNQLSADKPGLRGRSRRDSQREEFWTIQQAIARRRTALKFCPASPPTTQIPIRRDIEDQQSSEVRREQGGKVLETPFAKAVLEKLLLRPTFMQIAALGWHELIGAKKRLYCPPEPEN